MNFFLKLAFYLLIISVIPGCSHAGLKSKNESNITPQTITKVQQKLTKKFGDVCNERIKRGTSLVAKNWRESDGTDADYEKFCLDNFLNDSLLNTNFERIQGNLEVGNGHLAKIGFKFNEGHDFTDTKEEAVDRFFRKSVPRFDPYKEKLAYFVQLNFPHYTLSEKRQEGMNWDRKKWAMVRLGDLYDQNVDPDFKPEAADEVEAFQEYISHYFFRMDHISTPDGTYPFPDGTVLHCHFGLRDNLKQEYTREGGLARQEITGKVIEHILDGTVPVEFLNDTSTRWDPWKNKLYRMGPNGPVEIEFQPEGLKRYAGLLAEFKNKSSRDKLYDDGSTYLTRTFNNAKFTPEEIEGMIRKFLSDPVIVKVGKLMSQLLGRPLQPFDIWYSGFQSQAAFKADMLDALTRSKFPNPGALHDDLPAILTRMGFPNADAEYIGGHTHVRPIPSGGYSNQPPMRGDTALLTTVFNPDGLDYKAFRISMHELGHVVCGVYTTKNIDNFILADVPTAGITEGLAEMLAHMNTVGLGLPQEGFEEQKQMLSLATVWFLVDLGGQALTDIETWKWMYAHPDATPQQLKDAVLSISSGIWNEYYAEAFGGIRDQHILSIYDHFITGSLYLYNYFVGEVVMFQLYDAFMPDRLAEGLKTACKEGNTLPNLWMEHAVGEKISLDPILKTANKAVDTYTSF